MVKDQADATQRKKRGPEEKSESQERGVVWGDEQRPEKNGARCMQGERRIGTVL